MTCWNRSAWRFEYFTATAAWLSSPNLRQVILRSIAIMRRSRRRKKIRLCFLCTISAGCCLQVATPIDGILMVMFGMAIPPIKDACGFCPALTALPGVDRVARDVVFAGFADRQGRSSGHEHAAPFELAWWMFPSRATLAGLAFHLFSRGAAVCAGLLPQGPPVVGGATDLSAERCAASVWPVRHLGVHPVWTRACAGTRSNPNLARLFQHGTGETVFNEVS